MRGVAPAASATLPLRDCLLFLSLLKRRPAEAVDPALRSLAAAAGERSGERSDPCAHLSVLFGKRAFVAREGSEYHVFLSPEDPEAASEYMLHVYGGVKEKKENGGQNNEDDEDDEDKEAAGEKRVEEGKEGEEPEMEQETGPGPFLELLRRTGKGVEVDARRKRNSRKELLHVAERELMSAAVNALCNWLLR